MVMHSHLASFSVKTLFMKLAIFVILRANGNYSKLTSDSESTPELTLVFPMFPFDPPENIRKPLVF